MGNIENYLIITLRDPDGNEPVVFDNITSNDISVIKSFNNKIQKRNGFMFINQYEDEVLNGIIEYITSYMNGYIIDLYMRQQYRFFVDDDFWNRKVPAGGNLKDIMYRTCIMLRKIKHKNGERAIQWKVQSQNHSIYFDLSPVTLTESNNDITLLILDFDNKTKMSKTHLLFFDASDPMLIRDVVGPIVLCRKERDGENYLRSIPIMHALLALEETYVMALYKCVEMFLDNGNTDMTNTEAIKGLVHIDCEMYFIQRMMKKYASEASDVFVNIKIWRTEFEDYDEKISDLLKNIDDNKIINGILSGSNIYPLVDFSKKEYNFITRYISKKGILNCGETIIDITEILKHPRYGRTLRHSLKNQFITSFIIDEENDILRIYFIHPIDEYKISYITADFNNLKEFNVIDNLFQIKLDVLVSDIDKLPKALKEIIDNIPNEFMNIDYISSMIYDLLSLYVVFHDRPERTKVIKETKKVMEQVKCSKNKSIMKEKEYVISRILKPVKEAKEYIAKLSKTMDSSDREYVLEEWERIGHYRRTRNGNTIWIEATTCKRRLPLTEKEVHIKL